MDRDEAIRRAEIAMAWARGEVVQWRAIDGPWCDCGPVESCVIPRFYDDDWRIKPKSLECWVRFDRDGFAECAQTSPPTEREIKQALDRDGRWVRVQEPDE